MQDKKLRVRAHGDALVPNYERQEASVNATRCFIARVYKEYEPGKFGFALVDEVVEVPARAEYIKALKDGDLLPADAETASAAGLKLTPPSALKSLSNAPPKNDAKEGDS